MKRLPLLLLSLSLFAAPAFSQTPAPKATAAETNPGLTKFDLDFPGGTPGELVAAIQKAMGKPLNAIIPEEHANRRLPPLKMSRVDVPQLFDALALASKTRRAFNHGQYETSGGFYANDRYGFSDDTIWFFRAEGEPANWQNQVKICRVYPLSHYLQQGLTVDDITTAIRTSWNMLGDPELPQQLTFHQETKLLIAVADERSLGAIDSVLKALAPPTPSASADKKNESKP